jgi:hypothetical protein
MGGITNKDRVAAIRQVLERGLSEDEVARRLKQARDPAYWRELNPELSVASRKDGAAMEAAGASAAAEHSVSDFKASGWMGLGPLLHEEAASAMRRGLETVRDHGWPEVFAFVYDEFWLAQRLPSLVTFLSGVLGEGYKQVPHVWGHYVLPGTKGWKPHVDGTGRNRVTVWIALTDATLENSCMFLIPDDKVAPDVAKNFPSVKTLVSGDLVSMLQHVRVLPAVPGAALSWHHEVIHWSSESKISGTPRISFSQEFIAGDAVPSRAESPLMNAVAMPTLDERLQIAARAIQAYCWNSSRALRFLGFANQILLNSAYELPEPD